MTFVAIAAIICAVLVGFSLLAAIWRLLAGPGAADCVVALDLLGLIGAGIAAVTAVITEDLAYLYISLGLALFGFLTAVAFATLLERASDQTDEKEPV